MKQNKKTKPKNTTKQNKKATNKKTKEIKNQALAYEACDRTRTPLYTSKTLETS